MGKTLLVKFDESGTAIDVQIKSGDHAKTGELLGAGYQPATPPSWAKGQPWTSIERKENRGVVFEYPPHVRRWGEFKDALIADSRSQEILQAVRNSPVLDGALNRFTNSLDALDARPIPQRLAAFENMWLLFRSEVEALTVSDTLAPGIIDGIKEIAQRFDIDLPDPPSP